MTQDLSNHPELYVKVGSVQAPEVQLAGKIYFKATFQRALSSMDGMGSMFIIKLLDMGSPVPIKF